jgi:hypothetical protein
VRTLLIALDQALNSLVKLRDGYGMPDEMLSAGACRLRTQHPWLILWIDRIFFWDDFHCQECYGIEMLRSPLSEEYRR